MHDLCVRAGMTILCSDKTGTLTQNKMMIQEQTPVYVPGETQYSILRYVGRRTDSPREAGHRAGLPGGSEGRAADLTPGCCGLPCPFPKPWQVCCHGCQVEGARPRRPRHPGLRRGRPPLPRDHQAGERAADRCTVLLLDQPDSDTARCCSPPPQTAFMPFDPMVKRTEGTILEPNGKTYKTTKGAPHIILGLVEDARVKAQCEKDVHELGARGIRALAVGKTDEAGKWHILGLLTFLDPPRPDTKATIHKAIEYGVGVKMITGDHLLIAKVSHWPASQSPLPIHRLI